MFNTSASVAVLWLATTLARTNKRKWSLKKKKRRGNQAKLSAIAEDFYFNKFVKFTTCLNSRLSSSVPTIFFLINYRRKLFWHSNLNEPERKNFVFIITFRGRNSTMFWIIVMQMYSLFIHITNSLRTSTIPIQNVYILLLPRVLIFSNNWVSTFFKVIFILNYLIIILNYLILIVVIIFLVKPLNQYELLVNQ